MSTFGLTRMFFLSSFGLTCCLAAFAAPSLAADEPAGKLRAYIGTYTGGESKGIYITELDLASGKLSEPVLAVETVNPSFLALHPNGKLLYAVNETGSWEGTKNSGGVSAFSIDTKTGKLTHINSQPSLGGAPCHLVVDATGQNVLVANYSGGNIICLPINKDGSLKPASTHIKHEGKAPRAHSINLDAANRFAVVADLGLDMMLVYRFDAAKGLLTPNDPPGTPTAKGAGPRHFAFHPSGMFAYNINESNMTATAYTYDADKGTLTPVNTAPTIPGEKQGGMSTAEIQVHPSGKFVYGSNRGPNTLAIFAVDDKTGAITPAGHQSTGGKTPRNFAIDPTGQYILAENQNSGNIVVLKVDQKTGALSPTGHELKVPSPVCVKFVTTK